jgi:RNA polymerase sigma-70 factor (ECF subfamily)
MSEPVGIVGGEEPVSPNEDRAREFAAQFQASFRTLWLIAAGVVGDTSLAADAVQEAGIIALGKLDRFQPGSDFSAWVGQIVRNVARNRARKERRRRTASIDPAVIDQIPSRQDTAGEPWDAGRHHGLDATGGDERELGGQIMQMLSGVSDVARACLLLRTLESMEYARIAQLLEIPEGTAMSHVHRTRRFLRKRLADVGVDLRGIKEPKP